MRTVSLLIDNSPWGPVRVNDDVTEKQFWEKVFFDSTDFSFALPGIRFSIHDVDSGRHTEPDLHLLFKLAQADDDTFTRTSFYYRPDRKDDKQIAESFVSGLPWSRLGRVLPMVEPNTHNLQAPVVICVPYYATCPEACVSWSVEKTRKWVLGLLKVVEKGGWDEQH